MKSSFPEKLSAYRKYGRTLPKIVAMVVSLFVYAVVVVFILANGFSQPAKTDAAVTKYINFQGKLTNNDASGTNVTDGAYTIEFKMYTASSGGSPVWTETWDGSPAECPELTVTNGVFNAKLGTCNTSLPDFTGGSMYISVNVEGDGEMSPRKQVGSTVYALIANSVNGDGTVQNTVQSSTALTVARSGTDYAFQVDTNTASSATGLKVTSAAAGGGIAVAAISSGTNEALTVNSKGTGEISIGSVSTGNINIGSSGTGDILLAGGSGSTGCTVANSTGNLTCAGSITGAATGTIGYWSRSGTLLSPATAGDDIALPTGDFIGLSASTARLVFNDATRDNVTLTDGDLLFSADNTWDIGASGATRPRTAYFGTSVVAPLLTNAGALSITTTASNGNISLTPNGTGAVLIPAGTNFGSDTTNAYLEFQTSGNNMTLNLDGNQALNILNEATNGMNTYFSGRNITRTSGTSNTVEINPTFAPTSGTGSANFLASIPVVNQTGTATGTSRGIYVNPTLTSSYDFRGIETTYTIAGALSSSTNYGSKIAITNNQITNANTVYGQHISFTDAGSLANTVTGLYVDATTANTADTTYAALFQGGNVGVGIATPGALLDIDRPNASSITAEQIQLRSSGTTQTLTDGTTISDWRNNQFIAPTLNGVAAGGTETVTNAATLYVDAAPSGSNITITNPYSLWVDAGAARFDGDLIAGGSTSATETLANTGFVVNGDDLFVAGTAGVEGTIYSDSGLIVGASTTYANGSISQSASESLTIGTTSANLALQTTTSGNITVTTGAASGLVNILTGNLKVGSGSPGNTLNGDDGYITGGFEVDGETQLDGTLDVNTVVNGDTNPITITASSAAVTISGDNGINLQNATVVNNTFTVGNFGSSAYYETELSGNVDVHIRTGTEPYFARFVNHTDTQPMLQINTDSSLNWGPGGSTATDTNLYRSAVSNLKTDDTFIIGASRSNSAWGLAGIQLQGAAATYTDSSTAVSGTATNAVFNSFAQPTLAATNASVTTTNASTVYIAAQPAAGTNQTITNAYALWVDAGTSRFDGTVRYGDSTTATLDVITDGSNSILAFGNASTGVTALRAGLLIGPTYGSTTQYIDMSGNGIIYEAYNATNAHIFRTDAALASNEIVASFRTANTEVLSIDEDGDIQSDSLATGGADQCLEATSTGVIQLAGAACGTGSVTLQQAYDAGNSIETASNTAVVITETAAASSTGDLLQLTFNAATGGNNAGDALQITLDAVDANGSDGNGINIVIDQSQNTGNAILVQDDAAATLFQLDEDGQLTFGTVAGTTAITITDTDYTNALSIADNDITGTTFDIIGTTGNIDLSNFDVVGSSGNITTAGTLAVNGDSITADGATLTVNAAGNVDIQDALNADNITTDTGGVSIASGQSYTGAGAVTVSSAAAAALTLNSGTTGTINIGTDASAETINIGNTGAAVKTIAIGNNSQANTITIGDSSATSVSITDNNWSVSAAGVASFITGSTIGSQTFTTNNISDSGALTITANGASNDLTLVSASDQVILNAATTIALQDSTSITGNLDVSGTVDVGAAGGTNAAITLNGSTSGIVTVQTQAAAGTYNFNLPTTAGNSGYVLTSAGGGASAMTWTNPADLAVEWNSILSPDGTQSLTFGDAELNSWTVSSDTETFWTTAANSLTSGILQSASATALTTGRIESVTLGSALTTGGWASITGASYNAGAGNTGNLLNMAFTNAGTNTSGAAIVNGINIATTLNTSGATGTKATNAINIAAPTYTACSGGACTWNGLQISTGDNISNTTATGLLINAASGNGTNNNRAIDVVQNFDNASGNYGLRITHSNPAGGTPTTTSYLIALFGDDNGAIDGNATDSDEVFSVNTLGTVYMQGNVGIGDTTPASLLTVGTSDAFQVNSSGAIAAVVGITNTGAQSTTVQSATALTVTRTGTNYALQVDTNTASSATGLKVTAAAAGSGVALAAISSGTDEFMTIDGKGAGEVRVGGISTGSILFAGGSGSSGCTITTSGALTCDGNISGPSTGSVGYWSRSGTTISPATSGDTLSVPGVGSSSEKFGASSAAAGASSVAVGNTASSAGDHSTAVGYQASAATSGSVAIGRQAAVSTNAQGVAIGYGATTSGSNAVSLAVSASATGSEAIAIGSSSTAGHTNSIVLGAGAASTGNNQFVAGSSSKGVLDVYFGEGVQDGTPLAYTIHGTGSRGGTDTDTAGAALQFAGGIATGNAAGGDIIFQTSDAGASGTAAQSLTTKMILTELGALGIGTTGPDRKLDVLDASNAQLRLTQADGSVYTDVQTNSSGYLSFTPTGSRTTVNGVNLTTGSGNANFIINSTDTAAADLGGSLAFAQSSVNYAIISGRSDGAGGNPGYMTFATRNGSNVMTEHMRVTSGGQIGMGVAPTTGNGKLQVVTTAGNVSGIQVDHTANEGGATAYGVKVTRSGTASTAYGYYAEVSGATTNVGAYLQAENSATATVSEIARLTSLTSGTAANNIGASLTFYTEDTNGSSEFAGSIAGILTNATHGAEAGALVLSSRGAEGLRIINSGSVGIGTTGPDRQLEINNASGNNLRLTYNDSNGSATNYVDFLTSSSGNLTIVPVTGGNVTVGATGAPGSITIHQPAGNYYPTLSFESNGAAGSNIQGYLTNMYLNTGAAGHVYANMGANGGFIVQNSAVATSGSPTLMTVTGPANTGLTADTESSDVLMNLARTVQFTGGGGAFTNQRAVRILAPTYSATSAETITNAATLYVDAAPTAGTNMTLTNSYALWVDAGTARFDGDVVISGTCTGCGGGAFSGEVDDATNDALTFTSDDASPPAGTVNSMFRDNSGDLNINTVTGKTLNLQIAGTDEYNFSSSALAMNSNNITGVGTAITATAGLAVTATSANLTLQTATSGNVVLNSAGGTIELQDPTNIAGVTTITGATDASQLVVKANGTQSLTNPIISIQNSVGTALMEITTNSARSVFIGVDAGDAMTTGDDTVFIGNATGTANTDGDENTGVGAGALFANVGGDLNTAVGAYALSDNISGNENVAVGNYALKNTENSYNTAVGTWAAYTNTSGANNTVMGWEAMTNNGTGGSNVVIGYQAGEGNIGQNYSNNLIIGTNAGQIITSGSNNILLGYQAANNITSGANNIVIGYDIDVQSASGSNQLSIGNLIFGTAIDGTGTSVSSGSIGIGTTGPDRRLDVLDASNPQLRITQADGTVYGEFQSTTTANTILTGDSLTGSVKEYGLSVRPTVNQSSAVGASYSALDINVTETGTSSLNGLNRLADFRASDSSKFAVRNDGSLLLQNAANIVTPYGSLGTFQNHLTRSEAFDDDTAWIKTNVGDPTANTIVAPDGSTTAETLNDSSATGDVCQFSGTAAGSDTFTFSVWVRSVSGVEDFDLRIDAGSTSCATANNVTGTAVNHDATTSWQRFSVTQTFSSATGNVKVRIFPGGTDEDSEIYAWGAQLDKDSKASAYAYTTSGALTNTNRGETAVSNFATASGFTYGGRKIINLEGAISASSTTVGQMIRVNDNATGTDDTATVRALEVQSYSGTNINGVNTAIAGFGYTFGVHAVSTGQANEAAQPAAVFADLDNGNAPTQGNAIRAYSDNLSSADLVSFYHENSSGVNFTGNGLEMNFGNGSADFTGNYISLQKEGTESFHVDDDGSTFISLTGTTATDRLCWDGTGGTNEEIVDCTGTPGDLAENFGTTDTSIEAGDVVVSSGSAYELIKDGHFTTKAFVAKSSQAYQNNIIGIVSTQPNEVYADDLFTASENPRPVALVGRVPVKVTTENGPIQPGDYLTSSALHPGKAMKATKPGMVLGQALSAFSGNEFGEVIIFVNPFYYNPTVTVDPNGNVNLQMGSSGTTLTANTVDQAAYMIDQQGSGSLLQVQQTGVDRLLIANNGSLNLNITPVDDAELILEVKTGTEKKFSINARGDMGVYGVIVVKDDSFAGSIATNEEGLAEVTFSYHLGTGKPVVQLTPEAIVPVFAQVQEFKQDENGNYTGFVIKTFGVVASPISSIVHYNVTAKQDGYSTFGSTLEVQPDPSADDGVGMIIDNGDNSGNSGGSPSEDFNPLSPEDILGIVENGNSGDSGAGTEPGTEPTGNETENSTSQTGDSGQVAGESTL